MQSREISSGSTKWRKIRRDLLIVGINWFSRPLSRLLVAFPSNFSRLLVPVSRLPTFSVRTHLVRSNNARIHWIFKINGNWVGCIFLNNRAVEYYVQKSFCSPLSRNLPIWIIWEVQIWRTLLWFFQFKMDNVLKLSLKLILLLSLLDHLLPITNLRLVKPNFMAEALLADSKEFMSGKVLHVNYTISSMQTEGSRANPAK